MFKPLQIFADMVTYDWLGLGKSSYLGSALDFFIYDTIKIGLLLLIINYLMAIVRYYFPMEKTRDLLAKRQWFGLDYVFAAVLGALTPFCSCSSIPLFIGFLSAGIPLGVTFTFLISSPLVNESSLYLFPALFGLHVAILYNIAGIIIAIIGGILIQKLHMERFVRSEFLHYKAPKKIKKSETVETTPFSELLLFFWQDGWSITKHIFPYVLLGVGVGAVIHGFVPTTLVETYLSSRSIFAVPLAVLLGIPLYANSVSVIPIMQALVEKGIPLGTALAFMTAIVTVSIPEILILKKVMRWQLLGMFLGITILGIIIIGYLFNFDMFLFL